MENQIYEYLLKNNTGIENVIKNKELRKIFNINSDKTLRKIIQNIREDKKYKKIVGSVSGVKGGFYICNSVEEELETIDNITHRANQMLRMTHILKWKMFRC